MPNLNVDMIKTLQEEFREALSLTEKSQHRPYEFPDVKNIIHVAIGMRRSGKTYFMYQTIRMFLKEGLPFDQILYLNFEDDRILPLDHKGLGKLIDSWYSLYPENHSKLCYLFLDEVQNIKGWSLVLRRLLDTKKLQIYVTGSSAKLLSTEIATELRGRSLTLEILPYSYEDFLNVHALERPKKPFGKMALDLQRAYLIEYFQKSGFPQVQDMPQNIRLETLQGYVETVILRDIVERYNVSNIQLLKYLTLSLLKNSASLFPIHKFHSDLKSQGYQVGKDSLHNYLSYLEDAFLIFPVPLFTESLRRLQTAPKKVYAVDNGLILANTFSLTHSYGRLFENLVYLDLRRKKRKIFYYTTAEGYEIDFVTEDAQGQREMIQVAWDTSDSETMKRKERALHAAEKELGIAGSILDPASYFQKIFSL